MSDEGLKTVARIIAIAVILTAAGAIIWGLVLTMIAMTQQVF